jgi:hypothetical protein
MSATAHYPGGAGVTPTAGIDPRVNDTDPDHDTLTITGVTQGAKGVVTFSPTNVTYTYGHAVAGDLEDTDSFTYTISDGHGGTATATVTVMVEVTSFQ